MKSRTITLIVAVIAALVVGIGGGYAWGRNAQNPATTLDSTTNRASVTAHNDADAMFAQMMIPHHQQAVEMAALADTRASSPEVKTLALKIKNAQQPEIDKMNGWLKDWGSAGMSMSMDHSGSGMGGMMSQDDMKSLEQSNGAAFDKSFLEMMIKHHQGAIAMAQDELKSGQNADALALAASIRLTQQAEISQMQNLLKS